MSTRCPAPATPPLSFTAAILTPRLGEFWRRFAGRAGTMVAMGTSDIEPDIDLDQLLDLLDLDEDSGLVYDEEACYWVDR
ncbi:hypothetical protein ABH925_003593 [Streptacidiphilus sp. EB129]